MCASNLRHRCICVKGDRQHAVQPRGPAVFPYVAFVDTVSCLADHYWRTPLLNLPPNTHCAALLWFVGADVVFGLITRGSESACELWSSWQNTSLLTVMLERFSFPE